MKFPEHYTLWIHESGVITDRGNPRTDAYLYGAPPLGPRTSRAQTTSAIFRSPTEFVPHAIWLMRGSTGQCDCKYCIPGQNQIDINRRLNHGVDADSEDDDDGDDNGMVHVGTTTSRRPNSNFASALSTAASSSRRRARTRRVRRDRSPPININAARDYRVGATDPDPSPSSTE
jgi:hypothetical protein